MPARLLPLLPIHRPCYHATVDSVTSLPTSDRKMVILKMAHFVPLKKLPAARETAQILLEHVFHLYGLPEDIASVRGPQFSASF